MMKRILIISLVLAAFLIAGCSSPAVEDLTAPTVSSVSPADAAVDVSTSGNITATFDEEMDSATITTASFTLKQGVTDVPGAVSYTGKVATFNPTTDLAFGIVYTATVAVGAEDMAGNALANAKVWTFTTAAAPPAGPEKVILGTAGNYAILAETGITTTGVTSITGDIAVSPITAAAMTGFDPLTMDTTNTFATSSLVIGKIYAFNYADPTPATLTTAIADKLAAYNDAAGRLNPDFTAEGGGEIGGMTLLPGLYNWTTGVSITTDVTLNGAANDVWIFQIGGGMTQAATAQVLMTGGASPGNVFWQVTGAVALAANSHMEGTVLSAGAISLAAGATVDGRLLSQTAVTLDANTIVEPSL
ncbi:MAG: ice-binding family protein [Rectinemataceae bacterium]